MFMCIGPFVKPQKRWLREICRQSYIYIERDRERETDSQRERVEEREIGRAKETCTLSE